MGVEWKLVSEPTDDDAIEVDSGRYYIVGTFNDWTFQDELRPTGEGVFSAEVGPLPSAGCEFQVVRNQDWRQTFHPMQPEVAIEGSEVCGPSQSPEALVWLL